MRISDWSSDVCSSDLYAQDQPRFRVEATLVDAADADQLAVRLRVQPETGIADRPLDRLAHRPVPDLNRDHPRLRHADAFDLLERHHRSEERSVGRASVSTCRSRGSRYLKKKKT